MNSQYVISLEPLFCLNSTTRPRKRLLGIPRVGAKAPEPGCERQKKLQSKYSLFEK